MRVLVLILVLANIVLALLGVYLDHPRASREPVQEINPERIKLLAPNLPNAAPKRVGDSPPTAPKRSGDGASSAPKNGGDSAPPASASSVPATPTPPAGLSCLEWTGLASGEDVVRARLVLTELRPGVSVSERKGDRQDKYWVYIAPMENRADAEKRIAELKRAGISDFFVVAEAGEWRNAISLGVFSSQEKAQARLQAVKAKRVVDALTGAYGKTVEQSTLIVSDADDALADAARARTREFPGSEVRVAICSPSR
jgi:SPOR domain